MEAQAAEALVQLLGHGATHFLGQQPRAEGLDFVAQWQGKMLAVEVKASSEAAVIRGAIHQLEQHRAVYPDAIPLLATPFMGPVGKQLCAEHRVGWFDLSGNADISAPGLRILVEGKPNKFKRPGRASTAFAPKASRIARWLLMYGDTGWTQDQLSEWTELDDDGDAFSRTQKGLAQLADLEKGYASRVLKRLREQGLVRLQGQKYHVDDRDLLLSAWQEQYDFFKHRVIKGTMPVRSGEAAIQKLATVLGPEGYAATGLAGAWYLDRFATFRTATVYLVEQPTDDLFSRLSFRQEDRGANVWLVLPNDEGVFHGRSRTDDGVICVNWVQVYLDLAAHPERSKEAADHLRQGHQHWSSRGD